MPEVALLEAEGPPKRAWFDLSAFEAISPTAFLLKDILEEVVETPKLLDNVTRNLTDSPLGFIIWHNGQPPVLPGEEPPDQQEQFNIYKVNGHNTEDAHTHGRVSETVNFFPPGFRQIIHRYTPLRKLKRDYTGMPVDVLDVYANHLIETEGGGRAIYRMTPLGRVAMLKNSTTVKAPLSGEIFYPWEIHSVDVRAVRGVASTGLRNGVSFQRKGELQPAWHYETEEGLMDIKHLTKRDANKVLEARQKVADAIASGDIDGATRLTATSIIYTKPGRTPVAMQPEPRMLRDSLVGDRDPARYSEDLIHGMLSTALDLAKVERATPRHFL